MYTLPDFGFIAHPRTGSRSCRDSLMEMEAEKVVGHHALEVDACRGILKRKGTIACTTRNMWDLLVSWYHNTHFDHRGERFPGLEKLLTFEEYAWKTIKEPTHRWFISPIYHYGLVYSNHIVRYENLQDDWNDLMDKLKRPRRKLDRVGESIGRRAYQQYYTAELMAAVAKRWAQDIALTGAKF